MHEEFVANHVPKAAAVYERPNGSLTVEAAMALPILILGVFTITIWMTFFSDISEKMYEQNRTVLELAEAEYLIHHTDAEIRLFKIGKSKILTDVFPQKDMLLLISRARPFTGRYYETDTDRENEEEYVFVAETGTVYHITEGCTHLKLSVREVPKTTIGSLRNRDGAKYYSCEICGKKAAGDTVWITSEGNRFHSDIGCSGLKRTVSRITEKEAEARGLRKCTRCGK